MFTLVVSLKDRQDRRDAFSLPWEYEFVLQDRIINPRLTKGFGTSNLGAAAAHRSAIQIAKDRGVDEVLVLEDDAVYIPYMPKGSIGEVTFLGGIKTPFTSAVKCGEGEYSVTNISAAHAVIYRKSIFDKILREIPSNEQVQRITTNLSQPYEWWLSQHPVYFHHSAAFEMLPVDHPAAASETVGNDGRDLNLEQENFYSYLNQL